MRVVPAPLESTRGAVRVRVFAEDDVPEVCALFGRVFPEHGWSSQAACEGYFQEVFFGNPWRDLELHSLVAEIDRRIVGFYGVVPRPMLFRGRRIRVAVGSTAMVDPAYRHSFAALELARALLAGPQDLTLADGATEQSLRMWIGIGGKAPLGYNLHWTRPVRPASYALSFLARHSRFHRALRLGMLPAAAIADALVARVDPDRLFDLSDEYIEEPLDADALLRDFSTVVCGRALEPVYAPRSLAWLFAHIAARTNLGTLRARGVRTAERRPVGWYIYYLRPGGISEVVQLAARDGAYDGVLGRLLADARRHGAAAVRGRLDPKNVRALSARHCFFRADTPATLVHSRHPEIINAIEHGDAFLSRLDGEWWMRFVNG